MAQNSLKKDFFKKCIYTLAAMWVNDEYLDRLDIAIAGIHGNCWKGGDKNQNTEGMLAVINNPKIHIISHPGDGTAEMDFEQLVLASKRLTLCWRLITILLLLKERKRLPLQTA